MSRHQWLSLFVCVSALCAAAADEAAAQQSGLIISPNRPTIDIGATQQFTINPEVSPAVVVSAGDYHTCIVLQNGEARCTGGNSQAQRGDTSQIDSSRPIGVYAMTQAAGISAGGLHSCAVMTDHTVMCWGNNATGQLGDGTTNLALTPVAVTGITTATAVSAGYRHTCAPLQDGRVQCWGDNSRGQLGDGTGGVDPSSSTVPVTVTGITNAVAVTASGYHSCAVLADGTAQCWGENGSGQLGDGTRNMASTPVAVSGISTAVAISGGSFHTCALLQSGTINCWGLGWIGQLGDGTGQDSNTPVVVSGVGNAVSVDAGVLHTCAALADGTARCWGDNSNGQIGNGTTATAYAPAAVSGITSALRITAGYNDSCALLTGAVVRCWGMNTYGELGNGTTADASTPTTVIDISPEWTIQGTSVATIDEAGLATGVSQGPATVQVVFNFAPDPRAPRGPHNRRFGTTTLFVGRQMRLTVGVRGDGRVESSPAGIDCGSTCEAFFDADTAVTLTASPAAGAGFSEWSGCDTTSGPTCTVTMNAYRTVTAFFTTTTLTVQMLGNGSGRVTSADSSIVCETPSTSCSAGYADGAAVTLTAVESTGSQFTGWHFCDSTSGFTCTVTMNGSRTVAVGLHLKRYTLWVAMTPGSGGGTVSVHSENSSGSMSCINAACAGEWDYGSRLVATAMPKAGWTFVGWTDGSESVSGLTCTLTITTSTTVRAAFARQAFTLSVAKAGTGSGTVTSAPGGITCGAACSADFDSGTAVTLTATPAAGSVFAGWTGCDSVSGSSCSVSMSASKSVSASFTQRYTLTVNKTGLGTGTVTSAPAGINCGSNCSAQYDSGTVVTLTATPGTLSIFTGWTGCATVSGATCTVTMSAAKSVTAKFLGVPLF